MDCTGFAAARGRTLPVVRAGRRPDLIDRRVNFSYESFQVIESWTRGSWRLYGGGEYLLDRDPGGLERGGLQAGLEHHGRRGLLWGGRLVGGLDLRSLEHHDWSASVSSKLGLEFGDVGASERRIRIPLEAYDGFVPFGQAYDVQLTSLGVGVYFGL